MARLGKVDVTKEFWGWRTQGFPGIPRRKDREYLGVEGDERIRSYHVHKSRVLAADEVEVTRNAETHLCEQQASCL